VIDIEWGAFGDNGSLDFIRTPYEKEVDLHSNHVGSFTYVFLLRAQRTDVNTRPVSLGRIVMTLTMLPQILEDIGSLMLFKICSCKNLFVHRSY